MLSVFPSQFRNTVYGAICVWVLTFSADIVTAQPPPASSTHSSQLPAGLPPQLQKVSDEFAKANKLYAAKKYTEALSAYQSFLQLAINAKLNSSFILSAYSNIAVIQHTLGDNKSYGDTLRKIVNIDPTNAAAYAQLALTLNMQHQYGEAEQFANKALTLKSTPGIASTAHFVKGNIAVSHKDFNSAAKEFGDAAGLLPSNTMAHFNCGLALAELQRFPDAMKELETAHRLDSKNSRINEYLGKLKTYLAARSGHPVLPPIATQYDEVLKKDPKNRPALLGRANQLMKMGRTSDAESAFIEALQVMPDSYEGHLNLAHLYLNERPPNFTPSKDHYKEAQKIASNAGKSSEIAQAFSGLANAEWQEGQSLRDYRERTQGFAAAETHIKRAIDLEPKETEYKSLLGRVYDAQSRFKEEGDIYRDMVAASPDNMQLYARWANTYKAVRDIPNFVKVWKQYQARKPEDPTSYEFITEMYNQVGKYQDAIDTLRELMQRNLTNSVIATATVILGQDLIAMKRPDDANREFKKALAITPSAVPTQYKLGEKAALDTAQRSALKALAGESAKVNKIDEAISYLNDLKKREAEMYRSANQPPDGEVYKDIATLYEQTKRIDKALLEYTAMAGALPSDPTPHEEMGRLFDIEKKYDLAAAQFNLAAKLNTKDPVQDRIKIAEMYQRGGMLDKAAAELEALRKEYPKKIEVLTALALVYRQTKQDLKALEIYNDIIKTNPTQGWVQDARAQLMTNLERYADAEKVYVEEITRNPKARQTYADLERVYGLEGKADKFLDFIMPRFEKDPSNATLMSVVYDEYNVHLKREADGQAYILGVIEKSGAVRQTCLQAYATLLQINKHKAESLEVYRRIAKENPKDISAWTSLAEQLDYSNLNDEANQIYLDQIARKDIKPDDLFTLRNKLATRYYQQKKLKDARAIYQTLFNNNNKNFDAAMRLGDLIEQTSDNPNEAITFYNTLLGIPTYIPLVRVDIRDRLGNLYEKMNHKDDAIKQFQEAIKLNPDDAVANAQLKKLQTNATSASAH